MTDSDRSHRSISTRNLAFSVILSAAKDLSGQEILRPTASSVTDFQQALARLEEAALHSSRKGACTSWMAYR
jgi:hypothetical protein